MHQNQLSLNWNTINTKTSGDAQLVLTRRDFKGNLVTFVVWSGDEVEKKTWKVLWISASVLERGTGPGASSRWQQISAPRRRQSRRHKINFDVRFHAEQPLDISFLHQMAPFALTLQSVHSQATLSKKICSFNRRVQRHQAEVKMYSSFLGYMSL